MSRLDTVSPESPFGVPLVPFPAGVKWTTSLEMLAEVFRDVRHPWVRRYLLRPSTVDDIYGLTSTANYERSYSVILRVNSIPSLSQGFKSNMLNVRLNIPVMHRGDIGVGIGVESSNVEDSGDVVFSESDIFYRYVSNNARNSHLNIRIFKDRNTIEATYKVFNGQRWKYCILVFNYDGFLAAFHDDDDTGKELSYEEDNGSAYFEVEKLNAALIQSIAGGVHHDRRPKIGCGDSAYPYAIADNVGEHFFKNVLCSYASGQPMMAIPVFAHGNWSYDYDAAALRRMQNWGITDRLQRLTISPVKHPQIRPGNGDGSTAQHSYSDVVDCTTSAEDSIGNHAAAQIIPSMRSTPTTVVSSVTTSVQSDENEDGGGFARIAPLPLPATMRPITMEEMQEQTRKKKEERRLIKKREAAARSNAKRAERRKQQLLEIHSTG